jgi:hypothetical protein
MSNQELSINKKRRILSFVYYCLMPFLMAMTVTYELAGHYRVFCLSRDVRWWDVALQARFVFLFLFSWFMFIIALLIEGRTVEHLRNFVQDTAKHLKEHITVGLLIVALCLLIVTVLRHFLSERLITEVLLNWWHDLLGELHVSLQLAGIFAFLWVIAYVLRGLYRALEGKHANIQTAYKEWSWGGIIILGTMMFIAWVSWMVFRNSVVLSDHPSNVWMGMVKDFGVFTLIFIFLVQGLSKWSQCPAVIQKTNRWLFLGAVCLVVIVCAAAALTLDYTFIGKLETGMQGQDIQLYQRIALKTFIVVRDWFLLVPIVVLGVLLPFAEVIRLEGGSADQNPE